MNVTREQIEALVRRIADEFHPERIILFGSYALGNPGEDSDVDLLVILPVVGPRHRMAARIRSQLTGDTPIDVIVRSPADLAAAPPSDPLIQDALRTGVVLYAAAA